MHITDDPQFPCDAMFHDDPYTGTFLMFERELTQTEMQSVRQIVTRSLGRNSHWADNRVLCILQNPETD